MAAPLTVPIAQTALRLHEKSRPTSKESVPAILARCKSSLIANWLARTKKTPELNHLHLTDEQRTGHLPKLVDDLVKRLSTPRLPDKRCHRVPGCRPTWHAATETRLFFGHADP